MARAGLIPRMDSNFPPARVPTRVVILSICGAWLCYYVLATLRGAVVGFEFNWALLSRRAVVTVASMAVTASLWPLLQMLDYRPLWVKAGATVLGALPAALLLAAINQWAFADIDNAMMAKMSQRQGLRFRQDVSGNILIDAPAPPTPPAVEDEDRDDDIPPTTPGRSKALRTLPQLELSEDVDNGKWSMLTDLASGRYFLLLAWAALYLALVNGEQLRAAERREGEYRGAAEAAELRSLRYQVNPHFLFNTLNSLSALVMTGRAETAEEMIQTLSTFYRRTLSGDPTGDLTLAGEIELQQLYLDIEAVRFPQRLIRKIELPEKLRDVLVPGMMLQPLVENAVKYAVSRTNRAVTIAIIAAEEFGRLVLTVSDDGESTPKDGAREFAAPAPGFGIGLANVRDRLDARFGSEATLDAGPLVGGGFRTMIRMPIVRAHD
jgi:two-component system LytT family sensor kinase